MGVHADEQTSLPFLKSSFMENAITETIGGGEHLTSNNWIIMYLIGKSVRESNGELYN